MRLATYASVTVAFILIVIKMIAYVLTGSVAILSSLIDSVLDLIASGINLFAVKHALVPADHDHRYGHGKAEAIAGLAQAAFIIGSSVFLILRLLVVFTINSLLKWGSWYWCHADYNLTNGNVG